MTDFGRNHGELQMVRAVVRTIKTGSRVEKGSDNSCYQANDCVAGYSNSEIMEQLSISERTLYHRLAEAVDSDWRYVSKVWNNSSWLLLFFTLIFWDISLSYHPSI
jgi:hypothetical protein